MPHNRHKSQSPYSSSSEADEISSKKSISSKIQPREKSYDDHRSAKRRKEHIGALSQYSLSEDSDENSDRKDISYKKRRTKSHRDRYSDKELKYRSRNKEDRSSRDRDSRSSSREKESKYSSKDKESRYSSKDKESRYSSKDKESRYSSRDNEESRYSSRDNEESRYLSRDKEESRYLSRDKDENPKYSSRDKEENSKYLSRNRKENSSYSSRDEKDKFWNSPRDEHKKSNYSSREEHKKSRHTSREEQEKSRYSSGEEYEKSKYSSRKEQDKSKSSSRKEDEVLRHESRHLSSEDADEDYKKRDRSTAKRRPSEEKDDNILEAQFDKPNEDKHEPLSKRAKIQNINTRSGGAYIPPAKLRMMQDQIKDKGSEAFQRIAWEALKKSIVGMTNKVSESNIGDIVREILRENIIRGKGILARAVIQAQQFSPTFTQIYAALVAIINSKFPAIGELILKRLIVQYQRGFRRNDKNICIAAARFLAHLFNQEMVHEVLILEMMAHLLGNPTDDSIEIAVAISKECGKKMNIISPHGFRVINSSLRTILYDANVSVRARYMIEVFFAVVRDKFKDFESLPQTLDLVEEEEKYTHIMSLDDPVDTQDMLNVFKFDPDYLVNEEKYKEIVQELLGDTDDEGGSGDESGSDSDEKDDDEKGEESMQIVDMTETNVVALRRKIYLTIQSSLDFEECAHKLLKLELKPGQIMEMCYMILDCCAQQRTYEKFFGLLAQRFCMMNKVYVEPFTEIFNNSYQTIHRLETNKLRNVAKFFAHLLYTDAISWMVLADIKLNEEDTSSSSRIFIKILFQELSEYLGLPKLNERVKDVTLQEAFDGLFPCDHPHNTRFAINFFTSIGLGGLTDELREHLKNLQRNPLPVVLPPPEKEVSPDDSSSSSESSASDRRRRRKAKKKTR